MIKLLSIHNSPEHILIHAILFVCVIVDSCSCFQNTVLQNIYKYGCSSNELDWKMKIHFIIKYFHCKGSNLYLRTLFPLFSSKKCQVNVVTVIYIALFSIYKQPTNIYAKVNKTVVINSVINCLLNVYEGGLKRTIVYSVNLKALTKTYSGWNMLVF